MTEITLYVKRLIDVPSEVSIRGKVSDCRFHRAWDDENGAYSYYLVTVEGDNMSVNDVDYEIRVYEDTACDNTVYVTACVDGEIIDDAFVPCDSDAVTEQIHKFAQFLTEYEK